MNLIRITFPCKLSNDKYYNYRERDILEYLETQHLFQSSTDHHQHFVNSEDSHLVIGQTIGCVGININMKNRCLF